MTSILPMQNIKARTRALVPLQKPVLTTKTKRTGPETGPMRLGKLSFLEAAVFSKPDLCLFQPPSEAVTKPVWPIWVAQ